MNKTDLNISLIGAFEEGALNYPFRTAIKFKDTELTYRELDLISNCVANTIISDVVPKEKIGAVIGSKSIELYSGVLGILKASLGYVPLNTRFPIARNVKMIQQSGVEFIIVGDASNDFITQIAKSCSRKIKLLVYDGFKGKKLKKLLPENEIIIVSTDNDKAAEITSTPDDIAYLLFTSGSTGEPKGVSVTNTNVCSYLDHICGKYEFNERDNFSQTFDLTFDLSVHDMFVCWKSGACLVIPSGDAAFLMSKYIKDNNISVWFSVPSLAVLMNKMRILVEGNLSSIRLSFFCGEALLSSTVEQWSLAAGNSRVINLYGPSEATIAITEYEWNNNHKDEKNGIVSIGEVFERNEFMIVDDKLMETADSQSGELLLGGEQVIESYFNNSTQTKNSFVIINRERWYRTGDLTILENNQLYYLGRIDNEVKVSGYRINLLEIDQCIRDISGCENIASVAYSGKDNINKIYTFVVRGEAPTQISDSSIIENCKSKLPWYMIPEKVINIKSMPLNINGKIDRKQLIQLYL